MKCTHTINTKGDITGFGKFTLKKKKKKKQKIIEKDNKFF